MAKGIYKIEFLNVIRGRHHVYKTEWKPVNREIPICRKDHREEAKQYDKHAVGTYRVSSKNDSTQLVGHVPMELLFIICCFLRAHHNNFMIVKVADPRKLENGLVVPGSLTAFTQSVEMGRIFKEELLRVQALFQHMDISITDCEFQEKKLTSLFNLNY